LSIQAIQAATRAAAPFVMSTLLVLPITTTIDGSMVGSGTRGLIGNPFYELSFDIVVFAFTLAACCAPIAAHAS
jgi:hypothetical protein